MKKSVPINAKKCCHQEKERVVDALRFCEYITLSAGQRSACYQQVARNSGVRSRECILQS